MSLWINRDKYLIGCHGHSCVYFYTTLSYILWALDFKYRLLRTALWCLTKTSLPFLFKLNMCCRFKWDTISLCLVLYTLAKWQYILILKVFPCSNCDILYVGYLIAQKFNIFHYNCESLIKIYLAQTTVSPEKNCHDLLSAMIEYDPSYDRGRYF